MRSERNHNAVVGEKEQRPEDELAPILFCWTVEFLT